MVVVIGTGRWAREYAAVLLSFDIRVIVMVGGVSDAFEEWLERLGAGNRVEWLPRLNYLLHSETPIFVVSSAASHAADSMAALRLNCPTMVEKPIALTESEAAELVGMAESGRVRLCVSQVFLYSQWFRFLASEVSSQYAKLEFIDFCWVDSVHSPPRYDSSVPLFADVLPHLLAIVSGLFGNEEWSLENLSILRGGSRAKFSLKFGDVSVEAELERNGAVRKRDLSLGFNDGRELFVDFSDNGSCPVAQRTADVDAILMMETAIEDNESPLRRMIKAFLLQAIDGKVDSRLFPATSLKSSRLVDQIIPLYREQQDFWVKPASIKSGDVDFEDFWYASLERLQINSRISRIDVQLLRRQHKTYFDALAGA